MLEFSEEMKKSVLNSLDADEKNVLMLSKGIMDKVSGYFINKYNPEMADIFRSISSLLLNLQDLKENGI